MAVTVQTFIMLGAELQRLLRTGMSGTMASRRRRLLRQSAATFGPRYLAILNGSLRAAGKMDSSGTPISFLSSVLTRFRDTCHRRRRCGADAGAVARLLAAFPSIVCTCLEFLLHGDCEHVVFIKAVEGEGNVNLRNIPVVGQPDESARQMTQQLLRKQRSRRGGFANVHAAACTCQGFGAMWWQRPLLSTSVCTGAGCVQAKQCYCTSPLV